MPIIENINISNDLQVTRCISKITDLKAKKIGIIGLSFKAGTDDLRNSPFVVLVENLLGKGYEIKIYDKNVLFSRIAGTNKEFIDKHIPHLTNLMVDNPKTLVNHSEIIIVANKENVSIDFLKKSKNKVILDLVGLYDELGDLEGYNGINW